MKRTNVNFAIDGFAFSGFLALMSTGLLLLYSLPAGSGELYGFGSGHGAGQRQVSLLWGLTRHQWGSIHLWIAIFLIAVLAVHMALHWKWIVCVVRGKQGNESGLRFGLGLASSIALVAVVALPFTSPVSQTTRSQLQKEYGNDGPTVTVETDAIRGSMSFTEVARALGITAPELIEELQLPRDTLPDDAVGATLRRHGLSMSDLRRLTATAVHGDESHR